MLEVGLRIRISHTALLLLLLLLAVMGFFGGGDFLFFNYLFYLFIFGCVGSLLRCAGFSLRVASLVAEHGLQAPGLQ